jgi:hypothetical protein
MAVALNLTAMAWTPCYYRIKTIAIPPHLLYFVTKYLSNPQPKEKNMLELIKKKTLNVICEFNSDHIIQKDIEIKAGSNEKTTSTINVYCPFCNKFTNATVQGELFFDGTMLRELGLDKVNEEAYESWN